MCVCARVDGVQVCELPERLVLNNELPEAVTFAQAQVCFLCVCVCAVSQMAYLLHTTTTVGL